MFGKALPQIAGAADVGLVGMGFTSEDIDVEHPPSLAGLGIANRNTGKVARDELPLHLVLQRAPAIARLSRDGRWRRGELNPRPKSATARRLHA